MTITAEQLEVAEAGIDTRELVIAGPGTGKTHTLVARLVHLVEVCGVQPGQEVLVLSFTRNAVREIRRRVRKQGGDVAYVTVMTFDSFATRMLASVDPEGTWRDKGYDGRIRTFTGALREGSGEMIGHLADLRHILVDEIQDLVTDRADMVEALLEATDCGFTLLGDPAQAIYAYQTKEEARRSVADWVVERFPEVEVRALYETHRFEGSDAEVALASGDGLTGSTVLARVHAELREIYRQLPLMPTLRALGPAAAHGTVGVICRTNGQALLVSERLYDLHIDHTLFGDATSAPVDRWLARALFDCDPPAITRSDLGDLLSACGVDPEVDGEEAWLALRAMGGKGKTVDLARVAARLASHWTPDALVQRPDTSVVVSSIHRAKGLEFDQVVVVADIDQSGEGSPLQLAEESRVLYVAMTRARRGLYRFELAREWGMKGCRGRWVIGGTGQTAWQRRAVQLLPTDLDHSTAAVTGTDPRALQDYLWSEVGRGDHIDLRVDPATVGDPLPAYFAYHGEQRIGRTSESFSLLMRGELKVDVDKWPARIGGLRTSTVESVAGTRAEAERCGFRGQGFWLAARLEGFGRYDWSVRVGGSPSSPDGVAVT